MGTRGGKLGGDQSRAFLGPLHGPKDLPAKKAPAGGQVQDGEDPVAPGVLV
jgi:hypothetical protein